MSGTNRSDVGSPGEDPRANIGVSGTVAWRWSGVLLLVGVGLGLVAGSADSVPFYTETSALRGAEATTASVDAPWEVPSTRSAVARVHATSASLASGTIRLTGTADGATLSIDVEGLVPGTHVVRVDPSGDCTEERRAPNESELSFGDAEHEMSNGTLLTMDVAEDWNAQVTAEVPGLSLDGPRSVVGRAVVIRLSEPSGSVADARPGTVMACGTIGVA